MDNIVLVGIVFSVVVILTFGCGIPIRIRTARSADVGGNTVRCAGLADDRRECWNSGPEEAIEAFIAADVIVFITVDVAAYWSVVAAGDFLAPVENHVQQGWRRWLWSSGDDVAFCCICLEGESGGGEVISHCHGMTHRYDDGLPLTGSDSLAFEVRSLNCGDMATAIAFIAGTLSLMG